MAKYASATSVGADKSRDEIEHTLKRYGAAGFAYAWENDQAFIGFKLHNRRVNFVLPMPDPNSDEFRYTAARKYLRNDDERLKSYDQAVRQRWRALNLCIKAKLEAVEAKIVTFDEEFLAHLVLPDGKTVGSKWLDNGSRLLDGAALPPLLPEST